jgi:NADPH:quinone reductase-like Zn-dependent oxidoreductase
MAIPQTMLALTLREGGRAAVPEAISRTLADPGRYLELREVPVPVPGPGQVLIRVGMAPVNPSDTGYVQGAYARERIAGAPAGFEGMGEVVAGRGLWPRMLVGRRVAFAVVPEGQGSWAQYVVTEAAAVIPLMGGVRDEDGAALIVNPLSAAAMIGMVPPGGRFVATAAASQLGKLLAGLSRETSRHMLALVRRPGPVEALQAAGATVALDESRPGFEDDLAAELRRVRPTVLLDAVAGEASARVFHGMGRGARWVIYGRLDPQPPVLASPEQFIFMGKRVEGFWLQDWMRRTPLPAKLATIRAVQRRFAAGVWRTDVGAVLPLRDALAGLPAALETPDAKTLIRME